MTLPTLAQINEKLGGRVRSWGKYNLLESFAVGSQSQRYGTSPKTHILRLEVVTEDREPKRGTYKLGDTLSAHALCMTNGQHTGRAYPGVDTDSITCSKCLARINGWTAFNAE